MMARGAGDLYARMMRTLRRETGNGVPITFKDCSASVVRPRWRGRSPRPCTEIIEVTSSDEAAVCNLGSINLGRHVDGGARDFAKLARTVRTAVRQLDRVIDLNYYPIASTQRSNMKWRPVGRAVRGVSRSARGRLGVRGTPSRSRSGRRSCARSRTPRRCWGAIAAKCAGPRASKRPASARRRSGPTRRSLMAVGCAARADPRGRARYTVPIPPSPRSRRAGTGIELRGLGDLALQHVDQARAEGREQHGHGTEQDRAGEVDLGRHVLIPRECEDERRDHDRRVGQDAITAVRLPVLGTTIARVNITKIVSMRTA